MKQFTTIHALWMSFYSKALYRDVAAGWRKTAFLYLFLLTAVCLIPVMYRLNAVVSAFLAEKAPGIIAQVPVITISGGKASIDRPMPYEIKMPESSEPFMIIDTTGKTLSLEGTSAFLLLTETKLIMRRNPTAFDLSDVGDLTIDQRMIYDWIDAVSRAFIPLLYPFALIFSFLFRTVQALVFGAIGLVFARNLRVTLRYRALVSLSAVAMTPAILLNTLYEYAGVFIPFWWAFSIGLSLGYLSFAIKANQDATPESRVS